jgi:hypothetical protein
VPSLDAWLTAVLSEPPPESAGKIKLTNYQGWMAISIDVIVSKHYNEAARGGQWRPAT